MASTAEYICTLDDLSIAKARKELNEDPHNRMGAVETLRSWLLQQKHICFTTDTAILLRFLRYAKFSQLRARERIEKYSRSCAKFSDDLRKVDLNDSNLQKVLKTRFLFPLNGYLKSGERVVMFRYGALNVNEWKDKKQYIYQAWFIILHQMFQDERAQVNGMRVFIDVTGVTLAHQFFFTPEDLKKFTDLFVAAFPARYCGLHYFNSGPIFDGIFSIFYPFLPSKIKERVFMHGSNMEEMYKIFPKHMLPVEYLPDDYTGPNASSVASLSDDFLKRIAEPEARGYIEEMCKPEWGVHMKEKSDDPAESFRKLNVD